MKIKVKFSSADDVGNFLDIVSGYSEDVNLLYLGKVFDAKSLITIMNLDFSNKMSVQLVSNDFSKQIEFAQKMAPFTYRGV